MPALDPQTGRADVLGRSCSIFVSALGLTLAAGCGGGDGSAGQDAKASVTATRTVTATETVTATATVTTPSAELPSASSMGVFLALVEREYSPGTLRNIARSICEEVRTGDPDPSFPWREMIGYIGERRLGAFIAYSVATHCPEQSDGLIGLIDGGPSQGD